MPEFDPKSEESILPLTVWADLFAGPLFRKRMDGDSLARRREYSADFAQRLAKHGRGGSFWFPS